MRKITILIGGQRIEAVLDDSRTAEAIWSSLPLKGTAYRWGDEFYFYIKARCEPEQPREEVEEGDLGYWLEGGAFCIFFGRTPASKGSKPRAASPVNVFGRVVKGLERLRGIGTRAEVLVRRAEG